MTQATLNLTDQGANGDFRVYKLSFWQVIIEMNNEQGIGWDPLAAFDEWLCQLRSGTSDATFEIAPTILITTSGTPGVDFVATITMSLTATQTGTLSALTGNWELIGRTAATPETTTRPFFRGSWDAVEVLALVGDSPFV